MPSKFQLIMRSGPTIGALYPLEGDLITIGRDAANTIQINDAEISRRHARLQFQGGKYLIEDAGSTNGTHVNGQRLSAPYVLKPGDVVSFGETIVLAYETADFDPGATVATSRSAMQGARPAAPGPVQSYAGEVPPGPAASQPVKRVNPLPIAVVAGVLILICACVAFFLIVDYTSSWCTFFPFIQGCP
jgi:predicted component of type VI protein secretion system